jgi:hypothetical protein
MNLQFITDNKGETTGVYIPIEDWNILLMRYKDLREEAATVELPDWHQQVVSERMEQYRKDPGTSLNFDTAIDDLDKNL